MSNEYWNGSKHAYLKKDDVSANWINASYGNRGLHATNKAFCIWYHARKTTNAANSFEMSKTLEDCGYTGWGRGVDDLDEAFKHLIKNNGKWTDNTSGSFMYNGHCGDYMATGNGINVPHDAIPPSCRNFLTAVDDMTPKLQKVMQEYQRLLSAIQTIKLKPDSPKSDWERLKDNMETIKKSAEEVSRYLWLAPPTLQTFLPYTTPRRVMINRLSDVTDKLTMRTNQTVKFLDVVGNLHDSLTLYVQATQAFNSDKRIGLAFAGLSYALTYIPVLGSFYGEIVKRIPGLVVNWKNFVTEYTRKFNDPEAYFHAKEIKEISKWRCEICGSM